MVLLIVNDEAIIADTMKSEIEWINYGIDDIYTANDVSSAKDVINNNHIDILLCDIEMPRENGLSLVRWIREQELKIECIFLTCHANFAYAQEAISLGCQDYILLPMQYEDIAENVGKVAERIEKRKEEELYIQYGKESIKKQEAKDTESGCTTKMDPVQVVEVVTGYILENIQDPELNVESIADCFHFHPVYLNRIFKKLKNTSIRQFIIDERMRMAVLLLKDGNYNVNEVCEQVGYLHYTNFYNMFKKTYNMSPVQYIEKYLKK